MLRLLALAFVLLLASSGFAAEPAKIGILFLGDTAEHSPADRLNQSEQILAERVIART